MLIHFDTVNGDYFVHSQEIRHLYKTETDVIIELCQTVGIKQVHFGGKDKIYLSTGEVDEMHTLILESIIQDKNLSLQVKSFTLV